MDEIEVIAIYCLCEDLLKAVHHREDPQRTMSDAEVMTTAIVSARYFHGHQERACAVMKLCGYIRTRLGVSRFNRRLHRLEDYFVFLLSVLCARSHGEPIYIIDSFPIPVCQNCRISRCRLYRGEKYRGYLASKNQYFFGLKLQVMITSDGHPVEVFLTPGSVPDNRAVQSFLFDLPEGSTVYADAGYTHYPTEDLLGEALRIYLMPMRARNSRRPWPPEVQKAQQAHRRGVETVGSMITGLFPRCIHAVTPKGFELKVLLFVLAYAIYVL